MALIEVRLRPVSPWRTGNRTGDRGQVDPVYHSDSLYSAITLAMSSLGWLEEWLAAEVKLSSLFPFAGDRKQLLRTNRLVDHAAYRVSVRGAAAVDRQTGAVEPHRTACLEFAQNAGLWGLFDADELWSERIKAALRLLADSGFGGERSRGWGRAAEPEFSDASALFPVPESNEQWWLLSLFSPHETDTVDWSRSQFTATVRGGWTGSTAGAGRKKQVRMIEEGSILHAPSLRGRRVDVAPEGFAHPVYRSGLALAVPVPARAEGEA